jgi:hypothetical protein
LGKKIGLRGAESRDLAAGVDTLAEAKGSVEGAEVGDGIDWGGEHRAGSEGDGAQEQQVMQAHGSPLRMSDPTPSMAD